MSTHPHPHGEHEHGNHPSEGLGNLGPVGHSHAEAQPHAHDHGDHPAEGLGNLGPVDHSHAEAQPQPHAHDHEDHHPSGGESRGPVGHSHAETHPHEHEHEQEQDHDHDHEHGHTGGLWQELRHLLSPHSHDPADSIDNALTSTAEGIRAVKISLLALGITASLQLAVALTSGSVAVLADTIHNFADASTAIPLWLAFNVGKKPATTSYTYGYGRAEDLAGVFVLLMIVVSAVVAAGESIQRLINPAPIQNLGWVALAGLFGFAGNELVAQYRIRTGNKIGSAALVADGYHARTDGLTSLSVVLGAAGVWLGFPMADPIVGLAITVAILLVLKDSAIQMWRRLMDAVDPSLIETATQAATSAEGVQRISEVRARWIGHAIHAEALIVADASLPLSEAHRVAERARHAMLHAVPRLNSVTVHVDPSSPDGRDHHAELAHHDRYIVGGGPASLD